MKKSYYFIRYQVLLYAIAIVNSTTLFGLLDKMPSNYWFAGYMQISGEPNLTYKLSTWNATTNKYELSPVTFHTNKVFNIRELLGGDDKIDNCPYMGWDEKQQQGTIFLLIPQMTFSDLDHPDQEQQFKNDLRAGKLAPYVYVERVAGLINIYLVGPTVLTNFASKKLSFNMYAFENIWVKNSQWYTTLVKPAAGIAFAFSLDAFTGCFLNTPGQVIDNNAFYIYGLTHKSTPLGWSWTYQGQQNTAAKSMTMKKLQGQGIIQYQQPFIDHHDLQRVINFINSTGHGKFENILNN